MAVTGNAPSLVTGTNSSSGNNSNNNSNIDSNNTTVIHHNTTSEDGDWVKSLQPPPVEEATVVDSAAGPNCSPPMSTISLSSASPASVTDLADSGDDNRRVPNSPIVVANSLAKHSDDGTASPAPPPPPLSNSPSSANINSDFLSCFAPLGRFWPHNLFNWSSQKQIHSDIDTENYEIPIDSIDVQWEENFIGGGNQSSVFRGKYRGQWIALKKLNRTSEVDIKRLCSLEHANVIKTLGICTKEHFPCIVMEYCEKGSLFEHLRRNPKISKSMFINCSVQIAEGMCYLHSLKIVHRDLKSPNILIDKNNTVKICDFGSLYSWDQRLNSQTQNLHGMASVVMSVCGTSQWMSPEMLTNKPCNERVDVWSYGVVLWELLTGEVPYDKLPPTTVWFLVGSGNLQLHVPKTAPGSVSFLLTLCWAKNPRNRPSFKTILKDLLSNLRAELAELQEEGWGYRREQWKRDITDKMAKLHNSGMDFMGEQQREQELVKKRMHELRHAQEIRQMYEEKLQRVNKMHTKMCRFTELMNERKRDNERVADAMRERLAYDAHWHATLHEWHAELREWHAELRQQAATMAAPAGEDAAARANAPKMQNNSKEELRHILLRAETAKTAAMLSHGHEEPVEQQHQQQQWPMRASSTFKLGGQQRPKCISESSPTVVRGQCQAVQQARPAMLRMTYYDYDGAGRRHIGQKVVAQPQHQQQQQFRKFQRQQISSPMVAGSAASCSSSSRDCSSAEGNDDDDNEQHQQQRDQAVPATQPSSTAEAVEAQKRRKSCRPNKRKMQMMTMKLHHQLPATMTAMVPQITAQQQQQKIVGQLQEEARMGSCSSDTAMLRSSFGRNSADFELSSSKPISRDDSAISSTMPFSPSDRSLQNISLPNNNNNNNNNNNCPSSNIMACLNCQFGIQPQQISQFFARNSVARASGLSADSGVCQEDECVDGNANNNNNNWLLTAAGNDTKTCCLAPNTCQCVQGIVGTTTTTIFNRRNSSSPTTTTALGTSSNYNKWSSPTKDHLHYHHHHHFQHKEARLRRRRPPASAAGVAHRPVASQLSASFTRNCTLRKPSIRRARSRRRLEQQGALDYDLERLGSIFCSSSMNVSLADRRMFSNAAGASSTTNNSFKSFGTNCGLISMDQSTVSAAADQRLCRRDSSCSSSDQSDQRGGGQQFVPAPPPILISAVQHHHPHHWFSTPELYKDDQHQQQKPLNNNDNDDLQKKMDVCDGHHPAFGCEAMALNVMNNNNNNNNLMAMDCEPEQEQLQQNNNTLCCPIGAEMADPLPVTQKALAAEEAAMAATLLESLLSSSTMVSSLERSLELSAAHSDGLSDKEAKLKEVKTTFKLTHRRTSSNPIHFLRSMPAHQLSTSSSSANGAKSVDNRHQNSLAEDGTTTEESEEKEEEEEEGLEEQI